MLKLKQPKNLSQRFCQFWSQRTGKGYSGNNYDGLLMQVQNDYVKQGLEFREQEIPAQIDDYICTQILSGNDRGSFCTDRVEGLGDLVKIAIAPIAKISDVVFGTNLATCADIKDSPCYKRRQKMNQSLPFSH